MILIAASSLCCCRPGFSFKEAHYAFLTLRGYVHLVSSVVLKLSLKNFSSHHFTNSQEVYLPDELWSVNCWSFFSFESTAKISSLSWKQNLGLVVAVTLSKGVAGVGSGTRQHAARLSQRNLNSSFCIFEFLDPALQWLDTAEICLPVALLPCRLTSCSLILTELLHPKPQHLMWSADGEKKGTYVQK